MKDTLPLTEWPLTLEAAGQFLRPLEGASAFALLVRAQGGAWALAYRFGQLDHEATLEAVRRFDPDAGGTVSPLAQGGGWLASYAATAPGLDLCLLASFVPLSAADLQDRLASLEERVGWMLVASLRDLAGRQARAELSSEVVTAVLLEAAEAPSFEILAQHWISRLEKSFQPGAVMVVETAGLAPRLVALSGGGLVTQASQKREALEGLARLMAAQYEGVALRADLAQGDSLPSHLWEAAFAHMASLGASGAWLVPVRRDEWLKAVVILLWDAGAAAAPAFEPHLRDTLARSLVDSLEIFERAHPSLHRRVRNWAHGLISRVLGPSYWKLKLTGLCAVMSLALLAVIPSRATPSFSVRVDTDARRIIAAPWEGYIDRAPYRIGETVPAGAVLLDMNTTDLQLQLSMAESEEARLLAESRIALARGEVARVRASEAELAQLLLRKDLLSRQIAQGQVRAQAPLQILGGEAYLREGARVRLGESLIEVGDPAQLSLSAFVDETWVSDLAAGARAEVVLAAWPDRPIEAVFERVTSDAALNEGVNQFRAKLSFTPPEDLALLDGMRGIVRVDAGASTLLADYTRGIRRWLAGFFWRLG